MRRPAVKTLQPQIKASERSSAGAYPLGRKQRQASVLQPRQRREWQPVRQLEPRSTGTTASQQHSPAAGSVAVPLGTSTHADAEKRPPVRASAWERLTNGVWDRIFTHLSVPALRNFRLVIMSTLQRAVLVCEAASETSCRHCNVQIEARR